MVDTPNTGGEGEVKESVNDNAKTVDRENSLVKKYVSSKLSDKNERLKFIKSLNGKRSTPDFVISELEVFKKQAGNERFKSLEITSESVSIEELQREISGALAELHSKKITLRTTFLQEYDISPSEYDKVVASKIDNLDSESILDEFQNSDIRRDEFLKEIYKKKAPKRKLVVNALKDFNIEERYDKLEPHLKTEFLDTMGKFQRREKLEVSDIMSLFESNILTVSEKQEIIEIFMPSISLSDAKKLGIIDDGKAKNLKKDALQNALGVSLFGGANVDSYVSDVQDDNLIISTKGLFENAKTQQELFEQNLFFEKFKQEFDGLLKRIEEDLASKSIQTADEMKEILSGVQNISGIENFKEGATIVIKSAQKDASGNEQLMTLYAEVVSLASAGTFIIKERGTDIYNPERNQNSRQNYSEFVDFVSKGNIPQSVEFISPETLRHRRQTGEIQDINGNGTFHSRENITEGITDLTEKIDKRNKELRDKGYTVEQRHKDEELQRLHRERTEKNVFRDTLEDNNKETLKDKIDEIDHEGKGFGLEKGVNFVTKDGKGDVFSVTDIDEVNQLITVRGLKDEDPLSYVDFVSSFQSQKAKRVSKIDHFEELFAKGEGTGGFKFERGKVIKENSKLELKYNYLVPPAGSDKEILKIHKIDDTMVTVSFGKVKDQKKLDKKEGKDIKTGEVFSVEKEEYRMSIGVLDHYMKENKLGFRSLDENKTKEEEINGIPKPDEKFGLANWFFQGMSLATAIKGGKIGIEQITAILEEGDEVKANDFALKMFGPFLGRDGRTDMMSRVEQNEKKNMETFIQRLKDINSKPATLLIKSWLEDPRTPEYKKEAGMFYMFEKYGALCAKELYEYQGKYVWYQKMGGRVNDKVWKYTHENNNREPKQNTTEEQLVYNLISEQVKEGGYNGIKRRSKLAKELKALRGKGKEEEYDTGMKDGSNERDIKDRLDGALSEMSSGNYPNAFGWLESITNKGGTMKQMNMVPFVMMFSGMAYNFEKDILDKIKNFPGESRMLMMMRMMSYRGDIELTNQTIMEICVKLEKKGGRFKNIEGKARAIFEKRFELSSELDKQKATKDFYEEYGEDINGILYMLNDGDKENDNNKMIFFEKENSSTFNTYYEKVQTYINGDGSYKKNIELMADSFMGQGTSGLDLYKATELFEMRTGGVLAYKDGAQPMWKNEIVPEFEAIVKRTYSEDEAEDTAMKKKLLESNLRKFLSKIMSMHSDPATLGYFNSPTGYFTELNKWGIYFEDISNANLGVDDIKYGNDGGLVEKFVTQLINHEIDGTDYSKLAVPNGNGRHKFVDRGSGEDSAKAAISVADLIQGKTQKIMSPKPANSNIQAPANSNTSPTEFSDLDDYDIAA